MLENLTEIKSGSIIMNDIGEILYSSFDSMHETNQILEKIKVPYETNSKLFGLRMYDDHRVVLKRINIEEYIVYLIEFKDFYEIDNDTPDLKLIINKTREKLNKLVALDQNHQNEEVLELSRKLDTLIHHYITLETDLRD
jgi:hypothetical protein